MNLFGARVQRPPLTGRPLGTVREGVTVAMVLLMALAGRPAYAATKTVTVERAVQGAQTARFTLAQPGELLWGVTADRSSPFFGVMLAQVGAISHAIDLVPASLGPEVRSDYNFEPDGARGVLLPRGTYDLTLFSTKSARLKVTFKGSLPTLRFQTRPLHAWTAEPTDNQPVWQHDFPVTLKAVPHGVFTYMYDKWIGDGGSSQTTCAWQSAPCPTMNPEAVDQIAGSIGGLPGEHAATYTYNFAGADFAKGSNTVSVQSVVTGTPTTRAAAVLVVP
jgi:hypothetical protein